MGAEGTATPSPARVAASPRPCPCCWPRGRAPSLGTCPWCRPCCPPALGWPGTSGFPSTGLHPRFGETVGIKSRCQTRSAPPASVSLAVSRRDLIAVSYFHCTCSLFSPRKRLVAPAERLVLRARRRHRSPGTPWWDRGLSLTAPGDTEPPATCRGGNQTHPKGKPGCGRPLWILGCTGPLGRSPTPRVTANAADAPPGCCWRKWRGLF